MVRDRDRVIVRDTVQFQNTFSVRLGLGTN